MVIAVTNPNPNPHVGSFHRPLPFVAVSNLIRLNKFTILWDGH